MPFLVTCGHLEAQSHGTPSKESSCLLAIAVASVLEYELGVAQFPNLLFLKKIELEIWILKMINLFLKLAIN